MNRSLRRRIANLMPLVVIDCEMCRSWYGTVLMDDDGAMSRPESYPACNRLVPIECTVHIVGVPLDVL